MTHTSEEIISFFTLGNLAAGKIEAGPDQQARLNEFTQRVGSGEFHVSTSGIIPTKCIDGRCGGHEYMPNSAGGSETLMVADDLTTKTFDRDGNGTTQNEYHILLAHLIKNGYAIGGHTAAELHGAPSGCGANDKLPDIYAYIAAHAAYLREVAQELGYTVSDNRHDAVIAAAAVRTDFSSGSELLAELKASGGEKCVDVLKGNHTEVAAIINTHAGTTLDRDAVEAEFGLSYEAFNIDVWAFEAGARAISLDDASDEEIQQKVYAMVLYNLATAGVLCGPCMRVVVL